VLMLNLLLSAALVTSAAEFEVQTVDGQSAVGRIAQLNAQQLVLETSGGPSTFATSALAGLTRKPMPPAADRKLAIQVELVDQSLLAASGYTVRGGMAQLVLTGGAKLEVPTRAIRWVRFVAATDADEKLTKQWSEITETKADGDLLVVRKSGSLDYLEGVQGDIDADKCNFELDKEPVPVPRAKVEGVVYFHSAATGLPEAAGELHSLDGSRLAIGKVELADGKITIATPAGVTLSLALEDISRFDFSSGKIAYLSDLDPESATHVPYLGFAEEPAALREFYKYRRDIGFEQNPLRLDGKTYRKGLSLASRSVLVYKLPGKFRLFRGTIGIDDSVRETGDVHVTIKGDGKTLWEGDVRGVDPARELELEIAGVKRLEVLVDYGGGLDIGDRLDLCEARVTK
jgi:NPCBM/NEW2 domain-containing protein